ncbi:MAG: hypothetical protein COZ56_15760 [Armatimonadetes bacterium CG_4_8_14_3_um_filter_58_9]|nr:MAG: hypothetical protein COZ56_15760 [Armatimonadetes bacterium CG_4_8_14_3_um_filter_58_9]
MSIGAFALTHAMEPNMKRIFVGIGIILALAGTITAEAMELVPLEFRDIPVNGNDLVADPEAVTVQYGFSTRAGSKVVEHGDSICLLDSFRWIETPHVDWATPFANGPVRVLYIASQAYTTRNPIELAQRSDFDLTILQVPGVLSDGPLEQMPAVHAYFREKFTKLLSQEYDVIVLGSSSLQKPVEYILHAIRDKVSAGCGLVCLHDGQQWWRTDKELLEFFQSLSPISFGYSGVNAVPQRTTVASPVTDSISFALWPPTGVHKGKVDEGAEALVQVNGFPIVAAGRLGKGRVVGVYFHYPLIPDVDPEKTPLFGDYYEPIYSFYLKAVAWAAGKEPQVRLSVPKTTICRSGENASVKVGVQARDNLEHPTILEFRLQDPWGNPVSDGKMKCQAMASERQVDVALPQLLANGLYRLDLWLLDGKKVANWGSAAIRVEGGKSLSVEPLQKVGKVGDVARYKVNTGGATGTLHVRGVDDMDRVFHESTTDARDGSTVEVDLGRSCLPHNRVEFSLLNGKDVVARQYVDLWIPRVGLGSTADEFVLASYGWTREDTHLRRYAGALYREAGLNAIYSNWHSRGYIGEAGEMGLYSISGAMSPYLKQNNLEKELKSCPNKPESQAEWKKNIDQAIDDIQTYGGIGRVLDDEAWFGYVT